MTLTETRPDTTETTSSPFRGSGDCVVLSQKSGKDYVISLGLASGVRRSASSSFSLPHQLAIQPHHPPATFFVLFRHRLGRHSSPSFPKRALTPRFHDADNTLFAFDEQAVFDSTHTPTLVVLVGRESGCVKQAKIEGYRRTLEKNEDSLRRGFIAQGLEAATFIRLIMVPWPCRNALSTTIGKRTTRKNSVRNQFVRAIDTVAQSGHLVTFPTPPMGTIITGEDPCIVNRRGARSGI